MGWGSVKSVVAVALVLMGSVLWERGAVSQEEGGLESGGLGLTREQWEATYGAGTEVEIVSPIYNELYEYQFQHGTFYVAFAGSKDELSSAVMYVEIAFAGGGVGFEDARDLVVALIPSDARIAEPYFAPPTPGAPSGLNTFRYESEGLATVPYATETLSSGFLVIYVEQYEEIRTEGQGDASSYVEGLVSRVSIAAAIPVG